MNLRASARPATLVLALALSGGGAFAQAGSCERYQAELAALNRTGANARMVEMAARRQQEDLARLTSYYRSIGCDQASFFFQPAAECGAIAQRIRSVQASYAAVAGQAVADPAAIDARRRQLKAAVAKACDGFADGAIVPLSGETRLVCVRACDGYFFPLESRPERGTSAESLCRALCPNAETAVFRAPKEGGIEGAVSTGGKPYMQLANALRYQKAYDPSCSCRKPGESWAQTLVTAETMIARRRSDIVVTATVAEELSRPGGRSIRTGRAGHAPDRPTLAATKASTDIDVTGSTEPASQPEARPAPRVISPDRVAVPRPD